MIDYKDTRKFKILKIHQNKKKAKSLITRLKIFEVSNKHQKNDLTKYLSNALNNSH